MRIMSHSVASETSLGSRRETAPTADRVAGSVADELQHTMATGGESGAGPCRTTVRPTISETTGNKPRFLVVQKTDESDFIAMSPFVISKALYGLVGNVKSARKLGGTILVETVSNAQSSRLMNVSRFAGSNVQVSPHGSLNSCKGVITCRDLLNCSLEEIKEELAEQGIIDAARIKTKRNGELQDTASLIVTFNTPTLPKYIKAAFYILQVRPYIPQPLRCYKCQAFGHTATRCTKTQICVCGMALHEGTPCELPIRCVNCQGEHSARSKNCPKYQEEMAIQRLKTTEKISYQEARRKILVHTPSPGTSYARAASGNQISAKEIVNQLIPEIKKICESLIPRPSLTQGDHIFRHPRDTTIPDYSSSVDTELVKTRSYPTTTLKRKKLQKTSVSASEDAEVSDSADESATSSQAPSEQRNTRKKKAGWPKGKSRKPPENLGTSSQPVN